MKVWVLYEPFGEWYVSPVPELGVELEVGEATAASWEHAQIAYARAQIEIQDMVEARSGEAEGSV
jgi:hypothetical protein